MRRDCLQKLGLLLCPILLLTACATSSTKNIKPITAPDNNYFADPEERELFDEAERLHNDMVRKGLIYRESELSRYINDLAQQIQPERVKQSFELRYFVVRDPSINAFALPNGNMYLNIGLLNRLETESQLAFVMAHEAAHVIERHSFKSKISRRNDIVTAHLTDFLLAGTGLSYLAAVSNIASYSRELETEADHQALTFLNNTHYDLDSVVRTFEQLNEVKHEKNQASIWASHPDARKRKQAALDYLATLPAAPEGSPTADPSRDATFERFRFQLTENTVKMRLRLRQYQLAQETCEAAIARQGDSALLHAYLGDSFRLRAKNPLATAQEQVWLYDIKLKDAKEQVATQASKFTASAEAHYQKALSIDANNALALRGLGLLSIDSNEPDKAKTHLHAYLQHNNIKDRRYIESIVKKL